MQERRASRRKRERAKEKNEDNSAVVEMGKEGTEGRERKERRVGGARSRRTIWSWDVGARAAGGRPEQTRGKRVKERERKRVRGCTRKEVCTPNGKMQMGLFRMRQGGKLGRAWKKGRTKERCTRRGGRQSTSSRGFPAGMKMRSCRCRCGQ